MILFNLAVQAWLAAPAAAQDFRPSLAPPPASATVSPNVNKPVVAGRPDAPDAEHVFIESVSQEVDGAVRHLRGMVRIETSDMRLRADELDYNSDTGDVEARGHVHLDQFLSGEKIDCDRADYNINTDEGKFYVATGTSTPRIHTRPGLLVTNNPFYFEAKIVDKLQDRYILHDGFLTDCLLPRPWWKLQAPTFDIIPGNRAIAHHAWFKLVGFPLFYAPIFYKSLEKEPRRSGFILPTIGNSSTRGPELNFGYYWAINRSYDLLYRGQYYAKAGYSQHMELRGDVSPVTNFFLRVDGVDDTRELIPSPTGFEIMARAKTDLGHGWEGRIDLNYLSSFGFVQYYTESFNEAVNAETHSVGYIDKHFQDFGVYFVVQRNVNFQSTTPGDEIDIRKLPEVDFSERDHEFHLGPQPFWVSFRSSAGFQDRSQPSFQTRAFVPRTDAAPEINTAFHWKGINLVPSFQLRETFYGSSVDPSNGTFVGTDLWRNSRQVKVDLLFPSLERIYKAPSLLGDKFKHVIESRVTYTDVAGINDFNRIIRFDDTDILSDTNQVEFSITNRLMLKDKNGTVSDFLSWELAYERYFDPTFGGALIPGVRNAVQSVLDLTGYSFLDGIRHSSPVVSVVRIQSRVGLEWRADYDPLFHRIVNSSTSVDWRLHQYFLSFGQTSLKTDPVLAPPANQFRATIGYGENNRRGWGGAFGAYYDARVGDLEFLQAQVTYNTDCCGLSVQYRRFNLPGTRDESMYRFSFAISNIGTFGSLNRQERMF